MTARAIRVSGVALLLALTAAPAAALDYPTRPITLIVAHKPGGPSDVIGRIVGRLLASTLRQPLMIENRQGAGGNIAGEHAAHAAPDGYTLLMGNTGILAANPARRKDIGFDPQLDFTPITLIGTQANALVVNPSLPAQTLTQLIEIARAKPGAVTFASAGHGSASHLAGELSWNDAARVVVDFHQHVAVRAATRLALEIGVGNHRMVRIDEWDSF
jgi:tripartite-type tricarboxylate transporter receptor subunit TctC